MIVWQFPEAALSIHQDIGGPDPNMETFLQGIHLLLIDAKMFTTDALAIVLPAVGGRSMVGEIDKSEVGMFQLSPCGPEVDEHHLAAITTLKIFEHVTIHIVLYSLLCGLQLLTKFVEIRHLHTVHGTLWQTSI